MGDVRRSGTCFDGDRNGSRADRPRASMFKLGFVGERGERSGKNFLKEVFPRTPFQELKKPLIKYPFLKVLGILKPFFQEGFKWGSRG